MLRKKKNKEIVIPSHVFSRPPKTREEAVARLHFHFGTEVLHSKAVEMLDKYTEEHSLIPAYYFVINARDQIKKSLTLEDRKKLKELKNMQDNISANESTENNETDDEVKEMIDTWDIVNCRHCGEKISMLTSRKVTIGEDEYYICAGGH
jgi:hypothetical protein